MTHDGVRWHIAIHSTPARQGERVSSGNEAETFTQGHLREEAPRSLTTFIRVAALRLVSKGRHEDGGELRGSSLPPSSPGVRRSKRLTL
jgi:hypothetical protein